MRPVLPLYQKQTKKMTQKNRCRDQNLFDFKYGYKDTQQNTSKLSTATSRKSYTPWKIGIYSKDGRLV